MSVLPRTQLGYTLGLKRDKNIYGQGEKLAKNPFEQSRGRTRMAGEKRIDLFKKSMKVIPVLVDLEIAGYKLSTFEH